VERLTKQRSAGFELNNECIIRGLIGVQRGIPFASGLGRVQFIGHPQTLLAGQWKWRCSYRNLCGSTTRIGVATQRFYNIVETEHCNSVVLPHNYKIAKYFTNYTLSYPQFGCDEIS